jgi:hypothetical protein
MPSPDSKYQLKLRSSQCAIVARSVKSHPNNSGSAESRPCRWQEACKLGVWRGTLLKCPFPFPTLTFYRSGALARVACPTSLGRRAWQPSFDASLEASVYIRLAEAHGWRIRYVFDTHVHADYFHPLSDGATVHIGSAVVSALRTPGHTAESPFYLLDGKCLLAGDTLFLAAVGRPDLHANENEARGRARLLFRSLCRLRSLPPHLLVLPAHTSDSGNGKARTGLNTHQ